MDSITERVMERYNCCGLPYVSWLLFHLAFSCVLGGEKDTCVLGGEKCLFLLFFFFTGFTVNQH